MKQKMNLKSGMFNGLPAYACALLLLAAGLVLSVLYAVTVGSAELSVGEVYRVILYELFRWGDPEQLGSGAVHDIVWLIRLPRVVLAVLVGMGLSVVGAVMQAIVKNPLADPYVLGISSGASLGATLTLLLGAGLFGAAGVGLGAFIGALAAAFSVIAIAGIGGRITSVKLILAGVALSSLCSAFSNLIVYVADDPSRFMTVQFWLMGSLAGAQWSGNFRILCVVLPCTLFFISQARILNLMLMGDDTAVTLGTDLQPYRRVYLVIASLMVGFVVHVSGVIGFVGLIIPHTVRGIFGVDHKKLLPLSALTGSVFLVGVIGPNGSGKSTLLKCIYRVLHQDAGCIFLDGKENTKMGYKETARFLGVVAQHNIYDFDFSVRDIVLMGRSPHKKTMEQDNAEDRRIAREALARVGLSGFEERTFAELSGGEQQRVILARALAQQTRALILDEPTNHLDVKYQLQLLNTVKSLDLTVVAAFHDLNLAGLYCDEIYVLKDGRVRAAGAPWEVLTAPLIEEVYGVHADILPGKDGNPRIIYYAG